MKYAFIGLGNMAGAILSGMKKAGILERDGARGYDTDTSRMQVLKESLGLVPAVSVADAVATAQTVVLAVKPQALPGILPLVRQSLPAGSLVITVAAGKPLSFYEEALGSQVPVIRVMPSINAKVGASSCALCGNKQASRQQLSDAAELFLSVGTVTELPEDHFPIFSAIGGAAPAFVFLFMDALASAGVKAGLPRDLSLKLAAEMAQGSAMLLRESQEHPCALIDQVCSPGGTSIEGVHTLKRLGFEHAVLEAVSAVLARDKALGEA